MKFIFLNVSSYINEIIKESILSAHMQEKVNGCSLFSHF